MKKVVLFISVLLFFLTSTLFSETIYVITDDNTCSFDLSEISLIDFSYISIDEIEEVFSKIPINLMQNFPNPFKPQNNCTIIQRELKKPGMTDVSIYNIKGQMVKTLVNKVHDADRYEVMWNVKDENGKSVSNELYFYRIHSENNQTKKIILIN